MAAHRSAPAASLAGGKCQSASSARATTRRALMCDATRACAPRCRCAPAREGAALTSLRRGSSGCSEIGTSWPRRQIQHADDRGRTSGPPPPSCREEPGASSAASRHERPAIASAAAATRREQFTKPRASEGPTPRVAGADAWLRIRSCSASSASVRVSSSDGRARRRSRRRRPARLFHSARAAGTVRPGARDRPTRGTVQFAEEIDRAAHERRDCARVRLS